jgi:hypothetical protein
MLINIEPLEAACLEQALLTDIAVDRAIAAFDSYATKLQELIDQLNAN